MKHSYRHQCSLAQALDIVGERWSLLVVHELLLGPQRFKELLDALTGIGTKLLTDRLRTLEGAGVLGRRYLPPPAASTVYELTEMGARLGPVIAALSQWGSAMAPEGPLEPLPPLRCGLLWVRDVMFRPDQARGVHETYQFVVGADIFHLRVDDGHAAVLLGPARQPSVVFSTDAQTLWAIGRGHLAPLDALAAGRASVEGQPEAAARALAVLGFHVPDAEVADWRAQGRRPTQRPGAGPGPVPVPEEVSSAASATGTSAPQARRAARTGAAPSPRSVSP